MINKSKNFIDKHFEYAVHFVLLHEGGYVNDPDDDGGETNFGISKRSYPHVDIAHLTVEQAKSIYKNDFWDPQLYKYIEDIHLATKVFDLAVNMGPSWAHQLMKRALKSAGQNMVEDGILDLMTLTAINESEPGILLAALKSEAAGYYRTLAAIQPKKNKFLKIWLKRAYT